MHRSCFPAAALVVALLAASAAHAATFTVNSTGDLADASTADGVCQTSTAGQCTLRAALQQANATAGPHTIAFNIPGAGVRTIAPSTPLPQIVRPLTIDGYSQPGSGENTADTGSNAVLRIEVSGQNAGTAGQGLVFAPGASGSIVSGLILNRFVTGGGLGAAIDIATSSVVVRGSVIGLAADGRTAQPNGFGVRTLSTAVLFTRIGGTLRADRNVISGNRTDGVRLCGGLHQVTGNVIGLATDGDTLVDNGDGWSQRIGLYIDDCTGTTSGGGSVTIGAATAAARNVISGNGAGIFLESGANLVVNAYIGLNAAGTAARAPAANCGAGIEIGRSGCDVGAFSVATGNTVGGTSAAERVIVAGVPGDGLTDDGASTVVRGTWFGLAADGLAVIANAQSALRTRGGGATIGGTAAGAGNVFAGAGTGTAVVIEGVATATTVQGNLVGVTPAGVAAGFTVGVYIAAANATVGGTTPAARNVISGHAHSGITLNYTISGTTTIVGNFIGTTIAGTAALRPQLQTAQHGIFAGLHDATGSFTPSGTVTIGGITPGAHNVIAGNIVGVKYTGGCNVRLLMRNNRVGVAESGASVPNVSHGVEITGCMLGGSVVDAGNVIANNGGDGIRLVDTAGLGGVPIVGLQNNLVSANGGLGINLVPLSPGADGVTPNDPGDADTGPNGLLNYPVITGRAVFGSQWQVTGSYTGAPNTELTINFYANAGCSAQGHGEGQQPIGVGSYRTNAQGAMNFVFTYPQASAPGLDVITATATVGVATSEFSSCASDLRMTASDSVDPADVGAPVTYTMTVSNLSGVFASLPGSVTFPVQSGVSVRSAPGGTLTSFGRLGVGYRYALPALAPGGSATFTIRLEHTRGGPYVVRPSIDIAADLDSLNDTATVTTEVTVVVSGRVTLSGSGSPYAGVAVTLAGARSGSTSTDADGTFRFGGLPVGSSYVVTPARGGATFAPLNRAFANVTAASTGDFVATVPRYTARGRVIDVNGTGVPGIAVTLSGTAAGQVTTDADGAYAFDLQVPLGGTCTLSPSGQGFTFDAPSRTVSNVSADVEASFTVQSGVFQRYFAEGATSAFFETQFALVNASTVATTAYFAFQRRDGTVLNGSLPVGARSRATYDPKTLPGLQTAEFSTVVTSSVPLAVDRTMRWDATGYGAHAETGIAGPSTTWYLAEGATLGAFQLFYLIQNPHDTASVVEVRFLRPSPLPVITRTYDVARRSRFNVWVNMVDPALNGAEVSAVVTVLGGPPVIVERAMYLDGHGHTFDAGHESAGVTAPALSWFLAEGATGPMLDLFVLVANPNGSAAQIDATFLTPGGTTITRSYTVAPDSRFNIWVDLEDAALADTAVSTTITSTNGVPVVVERTMWWPGGPESWHEAHNSPGATAAGVAWAIAEGEVGGAMSFETYVLIANTSPTPGTARVTLLFDDGTTTSKEVAIAAHSRTNVAVGPEFPQATGRRFGALVESLGAMPAQIVVERAMYNDAGGVPWAAGTNSLGTRLR